MNWGASPGSPDLGEPARSEAIADAGPPPSPGQDDGRSPVAAKALHATGASALGALAIGAVAFGAVAAFSIGRLSIRDARIRRLHVDHLSVGRLDLPDES